MGKKKDHQDNQSMASASSRQSVDQGRKTPRWFSLRRVFQDLQHQRFMSSRKKRMTQLEMDSRSAGSRQSSPQYDRETVNGIEIVTRESTDAFTLHSNVDDACGASDFIDCPLCTLQQPKANFPHIMTCQHRSCRDCLRQYLKIEITESRVSIACPECSEKLHPNDIKAILDDDSLIRKYEEFMLRRVLVLDPDARWCPAPDCK